MKQELNIMTNSIPTDNTLRQVRTFDLLGLKEAINQFIGWYVMNCEIIREISEQMIESEEDVISLIHTRGLLEAQEQGRIMSEANRP